MPPGIGRIFNYCKSGDVKEGEIFHGMAGLLCLFGFLPGLLDVPIIWPNEPDFLRKSEEFGRYFMEIEQNCTRYAVPKFLSTDVSSESTEGHIFWVVGGIVVVVVLLVVIGVPAFYLCMAPSFKVEEKPSPVIQDH